MQVKRIGGALGAVALAAVALAVLGLVLPTSSAVGQGEVVALWNPGFSPETNEANCGRWSLDLNGFCVANDSRNGLEIGVKFQTSETLEITGVRIYRMDTATVTGSLWDSSGTRLAKGTFSAGPAHTWQDMSFAEPVTIVPGITYIASYFTPGTKYAFEHHYFASSALTVGPVTALRSVSGSPNGVHCYDDGACGSFPVRGYKSSTYWVTPIWRIPQTTPTASTGTPTDPSTSTPGATTSDREAPHVTSEAPAPATRQVKAGAKVKARFSEPIRPATLTQATVRLLRKEGSMRVATRLTYDATRHRLVLHPRVRLRRHTTYVVVITTRVRDTAGNRLDQDHAKAGLQKASWTFRTG
jgi:hypothetical protein